MQLYNCHHQTIFLLFLSIALCCCIFVLVVVLACLIKIGPIVSLVDRETRENTKTIKYLRILSIQQP